MFPYHEQDWVIAKLIEGGTLTIRASTIIGYCHCDRHKGHLTSATMKSHGCIEKQCPFMERYINYPYWVARTGIEASAAQKKEERKQAKQAKKKEKSELDKHLASLRETAQQIADKKNYPIIITRVAISNRNNKLIYVINYVSDCLDNDRRRYKKIVSEMAEIEPGRYTLRRVITPDGEYATISNWEKTRKHVNI